MNLNWSNLTHFLRHQLERKFYYACRDLLTVKYPECGLIKEKSDPTSKVAQFWLHFFLSVWWQYPFHAFHLPIKQTKMKKEKKN